MSDDAEVEVCSPFEPPKVGSASVLKLRPTRAMAVFIQVGLTWTPLVWIAVKASSHMGRGFVIHPVLPCALLCVLSTILIARRWKVRIPWLAVYFVAAIFLVGSLSFGGMELMVLSDPDRTLFTFFLEPQTVRVCGVIGLLSAPCTAWILIVREPNDSTAISK